MKKILSLIKASMTSDMSLFNFKTKKKTKSSSLLPVILALYLMFTIWNSANMLFEKMSIMHLGYVALSLLIFTVSIMTFMEGIYKTESLIFNCKDDQLLLSLPIKRRSVLFVRVFKFYVFELLFNSMFLLPVMIAYIRWADSVTITYFIASGVMLLLSPIIPIILSCFFGAIVSSISSRFKYKNVAQIIFSMALLIVMLYLSFNIDGAYRYIVAHATSINDLIMKIYYPAGVYAKLITEFNIIDLVVFIIVNLGALLLGVFVLSKVYFKINTRLKNVSVSNKKININDLKVKTNSQVIALTKKELNTFFKIPVFIVNAGFALVLFIAAVILVSIKFDSAITVFTSKELGLSLTKELLINNIPVFIFVLIGMASFMTSITSSVISLEGRCISILKSLPVKTKTILLSKILAPLVVTTPVIMLGTIALVIRFKLGIFEGLLLLVSSIVMPLLSHLIGIIVNLKYPNLDWESETEVVKQSASSFIAVTGGMVMLILLILIVVNLISSVRPLVLLSFATIIYILIDTILYIYLMNRGAKKFSDLM